MEHPSREKVIATFRQVTADSAQRLEATDAIVPEDFENRVISSVINAFPTEDELQHANAIRATL
jgi:hypothetical protein